MKRGHARNVAAAGEAAAAIVELAEIGVEVVAVIAGVVKEPRL